MEDPRTLAYLDALRAQGVPVRAAYGSLEGRVVGLLGRPAMEPGGRHAVIPVEGALERWDLDALEIVGRWEAPWDAWLVAGTCVGTTPGGFRAFDGRGDRWEGLGRRERVGEGAVSPVPGCNRLVQVGRGGVTAFARVEDGVEVAALERLGPREFVVADGEGRALALVSEEGVALHALRGNGGAARPVARIDLPRGSDAPAVALDAAREVIAIAAGGRLRVGRWDAWPEAHAIHLRSRWRLRFVGFTADGASLVMVDGDRLLRVDVASGLVHETALSRDTDPERHAFDRESGRALFVGFASDLRVADPGAVSLRSSAWGHTGRVTVAVETPDGRRLVTADTEGVLRVWARPGGDALVATESGGGHATVALAAAPDGREVVALVEEPAAPTLTRWSLATGELVQVVRAHRALAGRWGPPQYFFVTPDGARAVLVTAARGPGAVVRAVDLASEAVAWEWSSDGVARLDVDWVHHATLDEAGGVLRLVLQNDADDGGALVSIGLGDGSLRDVAALPPLRGAACVARDGRCVWNLSHETGTSVEWRPLRDGGCEVLGAFPAQDHARHVTAGRSVAVAYGDGDAVLVTDHGLSASLRLVPGCDVLGFSDDDRSVWVTDRSNALVLELAVPDALFHGP